MEVEWLIRYRFQEAEAKLLRHQLLSDPEKVILIEGFPDDNTVLQRMASQLGEPLLEDRNLHEAAVFEVKVNKEDGLFTSYANTHFDFPLHTDCSDFVKVPELIILYCVRPAKVGGESLFVPLSGIMAHLPTILFQALVTKKWKFRRLEREVIQAQDTSYRLFYNRIMIQSYSKITQEEVEWLDQFDTICYQNSFAKRLERGDLVLFRNDKVLHGRTAFPEDADRLLKRIRVYL